jgi:hypothetical protein
LSDITCTDPYSKTVYIIDVRIAWTIYIFTSSSSDGEYHTGKLAREAEDFKRSDGPGGGYCAKHHHDFKDGAQFTPFGVEISKGLVVNQRGSAVLRRRAAMDPGDPRHEPPPLDGTVVPAFMDAAPWGLPRK